MSGLNSWRRSCPTASANCSSCTWLSPSGQTNETCTAGRGARNCARIPSSETQMTDTTAPTAPATSCQHMLAGTWGCPALAQRSFPARVQRSLPLRLVPTATRHPICFSLSHLGSVGGSNDSHRLEHSCLRARHRTKRDPTWSEPSAASWRHGRVSLPRTRVQSCGTC